MTLQVSLQRRHHLGLLLALGEQLLLQLAMGLDCPLQLLSEPLGLGVVFRQIRLQGGHHLPLLAAFRLQQLLHLRMGSTGFLRFRRQGFQGRTVFREVRLQGQSHLSALRGLPGEVILQLALGHPQRPSLFLQSLYGIAVFQEVRLQGSDHLRLLLPGGQRLLLRGLEVPARPGRLRRQALRQGLLIRSFALALGFQLPIGSQGLFKLRGQLPQGRLVLFELPL